jgi:hypothetical protein
MFKKTFAEMLKENLNDDSFKPPPEHSKQENVQNRTLFSDEFLSPFLLEIKKFYLTVKDVGKIYGSRNFHKKMFKEPVKLLFYWCEEDWQGSLFVVYTYKQRYIYSSGAFGSCEVCDGFPQTEEELMRKFRHLKVSDSIQDIELHQYSHPELIKHFDKFKTKYVKNKNIKKVETKIITENKQEQTHVTEQNPIKSWAGLFK